jgi:hypothetical protein
VNHTHGRSYPPLDGGLKTWKDQMTRLPFAMVCLSLFPTVLLSDTGGSLSCTEALEQVTALQTLRPVYKAATDVSRARGRACEQRQR